MFVRFLILSLFSQAAFAIQFPLEIIEHFDDTKIVIYVQQADIDKAPSWSPAEGAPPLTIEGLVKDIQKRNSQSKESADLQIRKIELKPILHNEKQNRWYYLVRMKAIRNGSTHVEYVAVLMNGMVLPAIREPDPYK